MEVINEIGNQSEIVWNDVPCQNRIQALCRIPCVEDTEVLSTTQLMIGGFTILALLLFFTLLLVLKVRSLRRAQQQMRILGLGDY